MDLTAYRTLGKSGLVVSPIALGTMTYSTPTSPDGVSEAIFNTYVEAGGNYIETADVYAAGRAESLVGSYVADGGLRDKIVLATRFGFFGGDSPNPNAGGNGRKNVHRALEGSLRRLKTDYVDMYWMHVWDRVTPVEEMLETFDSLIRSGKIRYFGFSDMPAWYTAKAAALAAAHGSPAPIAMQLEYSLVERSVEREHVPCARDAGLAICPWGSLAHGYLAGKNADGPRSNPKNRHVIDVLGTVAAQTQRSPAEIALAWVLSRPGVTAPILGASSIDQLKSNLASLEIMLTEDQQKSLDEASALEAVHPYLIFADDVNRDAVFGGSVVSGWQ